MKKLLLLLMLVGLGLNATGATFYPPSVNSSTLRGRAYVTPYDFGAKGDGTTDDTIALQAWLDSASLSNVIALLAPASASPGYYKITDTLKVTNIQGIKIQGMGGDKFVSGPSFTRSRIRQFTAGANGILFLSANGSTNAPAGSQADGISIDSIYIDSSSATYVAGSIGIGFMGDGTDADCSYINQVGVAHFDTGFYIQSLADTTFHACSPGYNAYGVKVAYAFGTPATTITVPNNIMFQSCQLSYNYSNQLWIAGGSIAVLNCDISAIDTAALSAVLILDHGSLYADNGRFEEYCPRPAIQLTGTNHSVGVTIRNCGFSNPNTAANTYSILATNGTVNIGGNCSFGAVSTDTYGVKMVDTDGTVSPAMRSLEPVSISYIAASSAFAPYYVGGGWMRNIYATGTTPIEGGFDFVPHSSSINANGVSQGGYDNNFSILTRARTVNFDGANTVIINGPNTIDLLQYWKDSVGRMPIVNLWVSNSVQIASNTVALQPPTPFSPGAASIINSNGVLYVETSGTTAAFSNTNLLSYADLYSIYAVGTAYTLTTTPTLLGFGTTTPSVTITRAGTYILYANVGVKYVAATYAGAQSIVVKLRRTNNTAADLSNGTRTVELPVLTTFTGGDVLALPPIVYTATAGDIIQIFGSVSATPSAGSVTTDSAEILVSRVY